MICVVLWGSNYALSKYGIGAIDPMVFNAIRYVVAAIALHGYFLTGIRWIPLTREGWRNLVRAGLVANVLYQVAFITGLALTSAANSAIILATAPLWTLLLYFRLHQQVIPGTTIAGILLSLAGIVLIVLGSGKQLEFGSLALLGDAICLLAALLWALNTNLQKPLVGRYPPPQVTLVMVTVGSIGLSILAVPSLIQASWGNVHWTHFSAAIASGVLSIALGNVLWSMGVKRLGPDGTANFGNLVPLVALTISYFVLHERLDRLQLVGSAVTLAGIWVVRAFSHR
jgi:drug/metabolite transporter (DMT)-like permease